MFMIYECLIYIAFPLYVYERASIYTAEAKLQALGRRDYVLWTRWVFPLFSLQPMWPKYYNIPPPIGTLQACFSRGSRPLG